MKLGKLKLAILAGALGLAVQAHASLYDVTFSGGNEPAVGRTIDYGYLAPGLGIVEGNNGTDLPVGGTVEPFDIHVVVPEATTLISGALMLLPVGASALRILRRRQAA